MKPENPPAFPVSSIDGFTQHGMTLRDWFAGQAIMGICAGLCSHPTSPDTDPARPPRAMDKFIYSHAAHDAYTIADAMLAERSKDQSNGN